MSTGKQMIEIWMIRQRKNEKDKERREKEWMNARERMKKRFTERMNGKRKLLKLFIRPLSWCPLLSLHYYSTKPSSFLPSFSRAVKPKVKEKERIY